MGMIAVAGAVAAACEALRRCLRENPQWKGRYAGGRVRLTALWNEGAAFDLRIRPSLLVAASVGVLASLWTKRKRHPVSAGLILGGGVSNLMERLRAGRVYDYVQFPRAAGRLKRYVFNLADFTIFLGCLGMGFGRKKS